jgi:large subunit ribosomal protein L3
MHVYRTGLLGKKLGMTQVFTDKGDRAAVTAIHAGPNFVVDKITPEKHGYAAIKLGFDPRHSNQGVAARRTGKPMLGVFSKNGLEPLRFVREVRVDAKDLEKFEVGKPVALADVFKPMSFIDVTGTSKGKGFQGVLKRHHMPGFRATHGTHEFFRHGGSIGCRLTPGRVHKGKRMSGHMGDVKRTVQNLVLLEIDAEQNLLLVRGAVPGGKNAYLVIRNSKKKFGKTVRFKGHGEQQEKSKNPMKASKAGGTTAAKKPAAAPKK